MLPLNLSYIGTNEFSSYKDAIRKAGLFVLGVMTTLSLLGLFSHLATFFLVRYRGYVMLVVGSLIILMALNVLDVLHFAFHRLGLKTRKVAMRPYETGLTFGLIGSPCSTPIMFSVLAAATATGSENISIATMAIYAVGYTLLIFICSVSIGVLKRLLWLKKQSVHITRFAGIFLLFIGGCYFLSGASLVAKYH